MSAAEKGMPNYVSAVVPPSRTAALAAKALDFSKAASEAMWKHILIVLGVMLYIAFVVMATVFYYPNYYACMVKCGTLWALANAIVHAVFMVFLVFYVVRQFLDDGSAKASGLLVYIQSFDHMMPYILASCVGYLVISYGILFFQCRTLNNCDGCTPAEQTAFNTLVTTQVNRTTPMLKELQAFYDEYSTNKIGKIAACANYYSNKYLSNYDKDAGVTTQCALNPADADNPDTFKIIMGIPEIKPSLQDCAPLLGQFYVMTSGRTCVVGNQYDAYVSPAMIPLVLQAGARCLDFEVTSYGYSRKSFPIVTNTRNSDNVNLQHNFVLFEDVLRTIVQSWSDQYNPTPGMGADPLFLRFTLDQGLTLDSMNQMGFLIKYYFDEVRHSFLLPSQFNYQQLKTDKVNIGNFPLMFYVNQIVIMVCSPCANVTTSLQRSYLNDVVNDLCTTTIASTSSPPVPNSTSNSVTYRVSSLPPLPTSSGKTNKTSSEYTALLNYNRTFTTFVETDFTPSSNVNTFASCTPSVDKNTISFSGDNEATFTQLLANKQTINNNPTNAFGAGCQFIAMNFQDLSPSMKLYLSVFDKTSFVLKPKTMWALGVFSEPPSMRTSCIAAQGDTIRTFVKTDTDSKLCYEACLPSSHASAADLLQQMQAQGYTELTPQNSAQLSCITDTSQITIEATPATFAPKNGQGNPISTKVYKLTTS